MIHRAWSTGQPNQPENVTQTRNNNQAATAFIVIHIIDWKNHSPPPQAKVQLCVYSLTSVDNSGYLKRLKHFIFCLSHKTTIDVCLICLRRAPEHNICPIFCSAYCLKSSLREFLAVTAMILGYAQSYLEFISKLQWKKEKWK